MTQHSASDRLGRPALTPLVSELHRRFGEGAVSTIQLQGLTDQQRHAVADLLGSDRPVSDPVRLHLERLLRVLSLDSADDLRVVVAKIRGPIVDRAAVRLAARTERVDLWQWFEHASSGLAEVRDHQHWLERLRLRGIRGSVDRHRQWLGRVLTVLTALPADGVTLAEFAQDTLGDPHALDAGRSMAATVLDAIMAQDAVPRSHDAESTRTQWESVGVAPDALSSSVLTLGLTGATGHPLTGLLQLSSDCSEPVVLTLAQLRRWPVPALAAERKVFVVENPSVVATAARGGWRGPPIICSSGRPTVAVVTLVRQLTAAGAPAYQHADFDPAGVAITGWLAERAGTRPWKMGAATYRSATRGQSTAGTALGPVPATPWDPALEHAMTQIGTPVYEEEIRTELIDSMRGVV